LPTWIDLHGVANARDIGGIRLSGGGVVAEHALLRSGNLQTIADDAIALLTGDLGVTDVVDLRSGVEVRGTGPGPMTRVDGVTVHHRSFFAEPDLLPEGIDARTLPWRKGPTVKHEDPRTAVYLSYLQDRPDSIVGALRDIAHAPGASIVHCAAGKDRTGTIVALALLLVGADREQVIADYAASSERVEEILAGLRADPIYREGLEDSTPEAHLCRPETMERVIAMFDSLGGPAEIVAGMGWTPDDDEALRAKLVG